MGGTFKNFSDGTLYKFSWRILLWFIIFGKISWRQNLLRFFLQSINLQLISRTCWIFIEIKNLLLFVWRFFVKLGKLLSASIMSHAQQPMFVKGFYWSWNSWRMLSPKKWKCLSDLNLNISVLYRRKNIELKIKNIYVASLSPRSISFQIFPRQPFNPTHAPSVCNIQLEPRASLFFHHNGEEEEDANNSNDLRSKHLVKFRKLCSCLFSLRVCAWFLFCKI